MAKCRKAQKNRKNKGETAGGQGGRHSEDAGTRGYRRKPGERDHTTQALGDTEGKKGSAITQHRHSGIQKEKKGSANADTRQHRHSGHRQRCRQKRRQNRGSGSGGAVRTGERPTLG
ncbi:hypothetical protein NDU88_004807 [Pleurodeles waltl]|uniref:Uncharacterized protein n=1 Tax=Pleurodeles waltl TaxID=8319 RepID=A0AAV7QDB3_PLEWA|nr:hypothetical protein NDU88_004807 [Pleurodeles waltl]